MKELSWIAAKPAMRRVSADFSGDAAVELEMLEARIGITRAAKNKGERDSLLMALAVHALKNRVEAFVEESGQNYPDFDQIAQWLDTPKKTESDAGVQKPEESTTSPANGEERQYLTHEPTVAVS